MQKKATRSTARLILTTTTICCFLLTACGFQPMYGNNLGTDYGSENLLAYIHIENISNRNGQFLRNELIDRFYRHGRPAEPTYSLRIKKLRSKRIDLDLTQSATTTREQLRLKAEIELTDSINGTTILSRKLTSLASYNVLESQFSTRISRQNAQENALRELARQIETQITLYFNREAKGL